MTSMNPDPMSAPSMQSMEPTQSMSMQPGPGTMAHGGHLYMQTNEIRNAVVHYRRAPDGTLTEVRRVLTGGAGSGLFKPISGQESAPNAFEGARSVILTPDCRAISSRPTAATTRCPASASAKTGS